MVKQHLDFHVGKYYFKNILLQFKNTLKKTLYIINSCIGGRVGFISLVFSKCRLFKMMFEECGAYKGTQGAPPLANIYTWPTTFLQANILLLFTSLATTSQLVHDSLCEDSNGWSFWSETKYKNHNLTVHSGLRPPA